MTGSFSPVGRDSFSAAGADQSACSAKRSPSPRISSRRDIDPRTQMTEKPRPIARRRLEASSRACAPLESMNVTSQRSTTTFPSPSLIARSSSATSAGAVRKSISRLATTTVMSPSRCWETENSSDCWAMTSPDDRPSESTCPRAQRATSSVSDCLTTLPPAADPTPHFFWRNFREAKGPAEGLGPGGPDLLGALRALLLGGPELVARLRLLHRDRLSVLYEQVDGESHGDVLPERVVAALRARPVQRLGQLLLRRRLHAAGRGRLPERVEHVVVGDLDLLRLHDRRQDALPTQRALGVRLGLRHELLLGLPRDLQVALRRDALAFEPAAGPGPHLVRLRVNELVAHLDRRGVGCGVDDGLAELGLDLALARDPQLLLDVRTKLAERVEAARFGREVVVELGQALLLDLLDAHIEDG